MRDGGGSTEKTSTQAKLNRIMNQSLAVTATVAWLTLLNGYQKSVDALYGERIHPEHAIDTEAVRLPPTRGAFGETQVP